MAKIILILLALMVGVILLFSVALGVVRRLFMGGAQQKAAGARKKESPREILYEKDDVVVLKGEAKPHQPEQ